MSSPTGGNRRKNIRVSPCRLLILTLASKASRREKFFPRLKNLFPLARLRHAFGASLQKETASQNLLPFFFPPKTGHVRGFAATCGLLCLSNYLLFPFPVLDGFTSTALFVPFPKTLPFISAMLLSTFTCIFSTLAVSSLTSKHK